MQEEEVKEKKAFTLPNKKVKVVPIRRKGAWLPPYHEASHTFGNASRKYSVPLVGKGRVMQVLTPEEQAYLEKRIDRDLNVFKEPKDNYWMNHFVRLTKDQKILDLSDPQDYIDYKILLSNKESFVVGGDKKYDGLYKYFIDDLDYEDKSRSKSATAKKAAYKVFGQLTNKGKTAMADFLTLYYQNQPGRRVESTNAEWLEAKLDEAIEENIDRFLQIADDAEYESKNFIMKALKVRALVKDDGKYRLPTGEVVANSFEDMILWVKDGANSEEVLKIEARIEA